MRRFLTFLTLLIIAALAYLAYAHISGGAVTTFGLPLGGEKAEVRKQLTRFFEHVRFKNKSALPAFVAEGTDPQEIEAFLNQTLESDSSNIDLQSIQVTAIELDSSKQRARARINLLGQNLSDKKPFDINKVIFLYTEGKDWLIDIKNLSPSL